MPWWWYPALLAGGLAAGAINTIAGGGSLITLPLLIFGGLPATVANATNRIGVLLQNVAAVAAFRRHGVDVGPLGRLLLAPSLVGAALGTWIAIAIDERVFRVVLGVVMLLMSIVVLADEKRWLRPPEEVTEDAPVRLTPARVAIFFALGVYGGFLQAGIGIFVMAAVVLGLRLDLVRTNAVKVWLVLGYTALALAIFAWQGLVAWRAGALIAVGQAAGGWAGARLTVLRGSRFVRGVLVAVVLVSAAELLGAGTLIRRVFS